MCVSVCVVAEWSAEEVCEWLREADLAQHCDTFRTHDIRGRELLTLSRSDLKVSRWSLQQRTHKPQVSPPACSLLTRYTTTVLSAERTHTHTHARTHV